MVALPVAIVTASPSTGALTHSPNCTLVHGRYRTPNVGPYVRPNSSPGHCSVPASSSDQGRGGGSGSLGSGSGSEVSGSGWGVGSGAGGGGGSAVGKSWKAARSRSTARTETRL